ncbi:MAG: hypothetical protein AB4290_12220 [Spirulina sp.]
MSKVTVTNIHNTLKNASRILGGIARMMDKKNRTKIQEAQKVIDEIVSVQSGKGTVNDPQFKKALENLSYETLIQILENQKNPVTDSQLTQLAKLHEGIEKRRL